MDRRRFLASFASTCAFAPFAASALSPTPAAPARALAITLDDPEAEASYPLLSADARNAAILSALDAAGGLRAALFVCGKRVDSAAGRRHLRAWADAGHLLGNHSWSHRFYPRTPFEEFSADVSRCDALLAEYAPPEKRFRFPYLKEGDTVAQRDAMRSFLDAQGYRSGAVTIDASDWAIDSRLRRRLAKDPKANLTPYRAFFLEHIAARADYYASLANLAVGRAIPHTLLLHHNLLNALFLGDLLAHLRGLGWQLVDARAAFADPFFDSRPDVVPVGESLVWATARADTRFEGELRYPAEDERYEAPRMDILGL